MFFKNKPRIPWKSAVLEIGPGGDPFYRSTVLYDRFIDDSSSSQDQRGGKNLKKKGSVLVYSKYASLPFKEQSFDYVIASHVLEHIPVESFGDFVKELQRVAPRGYIEVPNGLYEYLFNIPVHQTILFFENNTIYYYPKPKLSGLYDPIVTLCQSHLRNIYKKSKTLCRVVFNEQQSYFLGFEFNRNTRCVEIKNQKVFEKMLNKVILSTQKNTATPLKIKALGYLILAELFAFFKPTPKAVTRFIACNKCGGQSITYHRDYYHCASCDNKIGYIK
jgi:hypothetical protein